MREIRKSASMSGDGKRDHDVPGVQSTRARPRLYPRGEAKHAPAGSVRQLAALGLGHDVHGRLSLLQEPGGNAGSIPIWRT